MDPLPGVDGDDVLKPSLFELLAQEQLRELLQPLLKYILSVFAQRNPRYLLRLVNRHEELYALLMFFAERHYLIKHGASFAEHFYGLRRRRHPLINTPRAGIFSEGYSDRTGLRSSDIRLSLIFLIGIPYMRAKVKDAFEQLGVNTGDQTRLSQASRCLTVKSLFKTGYPWANLAFECLLLTFNLRYILGISPYYRPWLKWSGIDIRRMDATDLTTLDTQGFPPPKSKSPLASLLWHSGDMLLSSIRYALPIAIFSLRFLEWLYSPSSPAQTLMKSEARLPIPPPRMLLPHPKGLRVDQFIHGQCPLCQNMITNATALPSGFVFCYRCAYDEVEKQRRCPVTLLPTRIHQLRKVLH